MRTHFTAQARRDLKAITHWIAAERPTAAKKVFGKLQTACLALVDHPRSHTFLEGHEERGVRRAPHGRYIICYRVHADGVLILRILDGARDVPSLL